MMTVGFRFHSKALRSAVFLSSAQGGGSAQRTFTSSTAYRALTVPRFTETSSPELDELFAHARKCFVPYHLSKAQQKLIFSGKSKAKLEAEPHMVNIGGEEFRLEFIDKTKAFPNTVKTILRAVSLMKDKKDWDNLLSLLTGFRRSKRNINLPLKEKLVRKGYEAGRMDVMIECARSCSRTGIQLQDPILVRSYMFYIQATALESNWDTEKTTKALGWAQMIVKLAEDATPKDPAYKESPGRDPIVIGVLLELSSIRATQATDPSPNQASETSKHITDADKGKMVAMVLKYAERFLASNLKSIQVPEKEVDDTKLEYAHKCCQYIRVLVPVIYGIRIAQAHVDPKSQVMVDLKAQQGRLEEIAKTARDIVLETEGFPDSEARYGIILYKKMIGE